MNEESFKKGEAFEKYVSRNIFTDEKYELIHLTNSFEQNNERFSKDTLKPDFKFQSKTTNQCFYVEAKFRTIFYNNPKKLEILSLNQYKRFKALEIEEQCPVFIIVGYDGKPDNPKNISLIPLKDFEFLNFYYSGLQKFKINKGPILDDILKLDDYEIQKKEIVKTKIKSLYLIMAIVLFGSIGLSYVVLSNNESDNIEVAISQQEELKKLIKSYYEILDNSDLENLNEYINPIVDKWYSKSEMALTEIIKQQKRYQIKYPERKTKVIWDTFKVELKDKDYVATYQLDYQIRRKDKSVLKKYNLKITSIWDANYKLKWMNESK
jgi:hypothetical protein